MATHAHVLPYIMVIITMGRRVVIYGKTVVIYGNTGGYVTVYGNKQLPYHI